MGHKQKHRKFLFSPRTRKRMSKGELKPKRAESMLKLQSRSGFERSRKRRLRCKRRRRSCLQRGKVLRKLECSKCFCTLTDHRLISQPSTRMPPDATGQQWGRPSLRMGMSCTCRGQSPENIETWWAWFISWTKKWRCDEVFSAVKRGVEDHGARGY
jgi:hypothetical protein